MVSLQGLARYAALTFIEIENLKVVVTSSKGFQHEFHVNKQNRLVLQQASLSEIPGQYKVELSGHGCVYVQVSLEEQIIKACVIWLLIPWEQHLNAQISQYLKFEE